MTAQTTETTIFSLSSGICLNWALQRSLERQKSFRNFRVRKWNGGRKLGKFKWWLGFFWYGVLNYKRFFYPDEACFIFDLISYIFDRLPWFVIDFLSSFWITNETRGKFVEKRFEFCEKFLNFADDCFGDFHKVSFK